jgi:hypothetical protein
MKIDPNKGRIDQGESTREREQRGRIENLERQIEELKRRLPPKPVPLDGKGKQ